MEHEREQRVKRTQRDYSFAFKMMVVHEVEKGGFKSMLTLNEAIIDVKVKSKALKWFSSFLEITTSSKTTPYSMPYFAIITFNSYSK